MPIRKQSGQPITGEFGGGATVDMPVVALQVSQSLSVGSDPQSAFICREATDPVAGQWRIAGAQASPLTVLVAAQAPTPTSSPKHVASLGQRRYAALHQAVPAAVACQVGAVPVVQPIRSADPEGVLADKQRLDGRAQQAVLDPQNRPGVVRSGTRGEEGGRGDHGDRAQRKKSTPTCRVGGLHFTGGP